MPINYEQLRPQIIQAGKGIADSRKAAVEQQADVLERFGKLTALSADELNERMAEILSANEGERLAVPGSDPIDARFPEPPESAERVRILACDGSQITPNHHDELSFGLINTAVISFSAHSGEAPRIYYNTRYLEAAEAGGEGRVAMIRDAEEKQQLAEQALACGADLPRLAFCDGSLELYTEKTEIPGQAEFREKYLAAMRRFGEQRIPVAGYIDRPRSNPVLTTIALLDGTTAESRYGQLCDANLFAAFLRSGERSAVFGLNSRFNAELPPELRICFFYLNVGVPGHPYLSRVEIPAWAAADGCVLDLLHRNLLAQCRLLGDHPYPYVLHRAHECALVTYAEKDRIKDMLLQELLRRGEMIGEKSNKQFAKDSMGSVCAS